MRSAAGGRLGSCLPVICIRHTEDGVSYHVYDEGNYHNKPHNRFRYDDAHVADGGRQQKGDGDFAHKLQRTGEDGGFAVAKALHTGAEQADGSGYKVKDRIDFQIQGGSVNHFFFAGGGNQPYQGRRNGIGCQKNDGAPCQGEKQGVPYAGFDAGVFAGAQILPAERGERGAEHGKGKHKDRSDFPRSGMRYNNVGAEGVDGGLQRKGAKIDKGNHKAHGDAGGKKLFVKLL